MASNELSAEGKAVTSRMLMIMRALIAYDAKVKNQSEFAEALGIGNVAISQWIAGVRTATVKDIVRACSTFRANPIFLLLGTGDMFLNKPQEMKTSSIEMTLAELNLRVGQLEILNRKAEREVQNGKKKR